MKKDNAVDKLMLIISMLIVGSLGIFVQHIPLPRSAIALSRAVIGTLVILPVFLLKRKNIDLKNIKKNAVPLLLSGIALGFNWMLLFEAYNYTTVQVATLCYYMAPVFVIIASPFILKEKLTAFNIMCTVGSVFGAIMISGVFSGSMTGGKGIFFGLAAALLYASIVILNKLISGISGIERTFFQLFISALVMLIYVFSTENISEFTLNGTQIALLIIVGVIHTGVVYILFFTSISRLPAQTASVLSYIDPVSAIIMSGIILREKMDMFQIIGTVLIIGFAMANEILSSKRA